jgi:cold shock CspA family protein
MLGTVKRFEQGRGFGWIEPDDEDANDCFVHISDCPGHTALAVGARVEFQTSDVGRGPRAVHLALLSE